MRNWIKILIVLSLLFFAGFLFGWVFGSQHEAVYSTVEKALLNL